MADFVYRTQTDTFGNSFYHLTDIQFRPNGDIEDTVTITGKLVSGYNKAQPKIEPGTIKTLFNVPKYAVQQGFHNIFSTKFKGTVIKPYRGKR